jgi:hypothetical protein
MRRSWPYVNVPVEPDQHRRLRELSERKATPATDLLRPLVKQLLDEQPKNTRRIKRPTP